MANLKENCESVFATIDRAHNVQELKDYQPEFLKKYFLDTCKYPPINFIISKEEIRKLGGLNLTLSDQLSQESLTSLEKLMLSILWKNGDFGKEKHIIQGILGKYSFDEKNSGHVFYQFGKRLNNPKNEPIIDQHIIRAFIFHKKSLKEVSKFNQLEKKQIPDIKNYIKWARLQAEKIIGEKEQVLYEIDRLLFALGKYIKKKI